MRKYCSIGGVIEACPNLSTLDKMQSSSISFAIEPDGAVEVIGSFDRFQSSSFVNVGSFFPQSSLLKVDLQKLTNSIGKVLFEKGVFGFCSVDLVVFPNEEEPTAHPLFWAVDLTTELTDNMSICFFFQQLMDGQLD